MRSVISIRRRDMHGRAGGQVSALQPTQPPKVLTDAYEQTKAYVEHAYEKSKAFLIESAQGQASKERVTLTGAGQQGEADARKPIASGAAIGAYGRAGTQSSLSTDQPRQPPQVLSDAYAKTSAYVKHAYEKTAEFLTQSTQHPTAEQPAPFSGS